MITLRAFTEEEEASAKPLLAAKVASMMGRKLEEGDWNDVYCKAKEIPDRGWSNLRIDVNHNGLGVEFKMLRVAQLRGKSIREVCGTSRMHPSATRSIRIDNTDLPAHEVMTDVLTQYADLIEERTEQVKNKSPSGEVDMRVGWLLWEDDLKEFLYFEELMKKPDPVEYTAIWNETPARGARKASKSLWIFDKATGAKRFSVTTSAGIKIQPYFDVPHPHDPNLIYFRVQSEPLGNDIVVLWVTASTADQLKELLGSLDPQVVSDAIFRASRAGAINESNEVTYASIAFPLHIPKEAFELFVEHWDAVSDEHRVQQLIRALRSTAKA